MAVHPVGSMSDLITLSKYWRQTSLDHRMLPKLMLKIAPRSPTHDAPPTTTSREANEATLFCSNRVNRALLAQGRPHTKAILSLKIQRKSGPL